jgi:hypothetical protein
LYVTGWHCTNDVQMNTPETHFFAPLAFVTEACNRNDTMGLALLWVWVGKVHSIILVACFGNKLDFCWSQGGVGVDIFSVLALHVSTWVTYSPQDSVQRLLLFNWFVSFYFAA